MEVECSCAFLPSDKIPSDRFTNTFRSQILNKPFIADSSI